MKESGASPMTTVSRVFCLGLVIGVVAGLVAGLIEIRDHRYFEQGLTNLVVLTLSHGVNGAVRDVLITLCILAGLVTVLYGLTRSWAKVAVHCIAIAGTFVTVVVATNAILYYVLFEHAAKLLQNFQHNIGPEQAAQLLEPVRGTFLGVYSIPLSSLSEHWGKVLLFCLVNLLMGMALGWIVIRALQRLRPGLLAGGGLPGWTRHRVVRAFAPMGSRKAAAIALLVLVAGNGGAVWTLHGQKENLRDRPNVILISVDTLRADHLGCYGYGPETSPVIDGLAQRAVLFEEVVAASPWTLPSHVSMVTSLYPASHGCSLVGGAKLQRRITTLAEILRNGGYRTRAITTILYLTQIYGFEQGFESLLALGNRAPAERVTDEAIEWLKGHREDRFFLFLHFYDPHTDYTPPPGYVERFDPDYTGPIDGTVPNLLEHQEEMTQEDLANLVARYDGEIAYVDHELGRLFDQIREMGLSENSLIVLTSDHGEEFREHGSFGHGFTLYDEQLLVPLLISWPGRLREGHRAKETVQLIDIVPTILDLIGLGDLPGSLEGVTLMRHCTGSEPVSALPRDAFSQTQLGEKELYSDRVQGAKAIFDATSDDWELYNLVSDPGETTNLAATDPERLSAFSSRLDPYIEHARRVRERSQREADKVELDEESVETLKSLGYIQ